MNAYDKLLAQIQTAIAASRPNVPPHPNRHQKARGAAHARPAVQKAKAAKHHKARRASKRRKASR